jgi:hypothetical protein
MRKLVEGAIEAFEVFLDGFSAIDVQRCGDLFGQLLEGAILAMQNSVASLKASII